MPEHVVMYSRLNDIIKHIFPGDVLILADADDEDDEPSIILCYLKKGEIAPKDWADARRQFIGSGSESTVSPPLQDAEYLTHQESEAMTRVLGWYGSMRGSHRQFFVDVDDLRIAGGEARAEAAERQLGEARAEALAHNKACTAVNCGHAERALRALSDTGSEAAGKEPK